MSESSTRRCDVRPLYVAASVVFFCWAAYAVSTIISIRKESRLTRTMHECYFGWLADGQARPGWSHHWIWATDMPGPLHTHGDIELWPEGPGARGTVDLHEDES